MALNAASHNSGILLMRYQRVDWLMNLIAGVKTGPVTEQPPQASSDAVSDLLGASKDDPMGQHQGGNDGGEKDAEKKLKSEKERMDPEPI